MMQETGELLAMGSNVEVELYLIRRMDCLSSVTTGKAECMGTAARAG